MAVVIQTEKLDMGRTEMNKVNSKYKLWHIKFIE